MLRMLGVATTLAAFAIQVPAQSPSQRPRIEVIPTGPEAIRGPILLFSGGADPIWPSAFMAELVTERLKAKGFAHPVLRFSYDSAGHAFARPGFLSTAPAGFSGGSPRANAYAQVDSWRRMLDFLAEWRRNGPTAAPRQGSERR